MTCEEFWNQMPELADTAAAVPPEHIRECAACAGSFNRQLALAAGLKTMAAESRRVVAPAKLEARLLSAFHARSAIVPRRLPRRAWLPLLSWASAAAALLAIGLFVAPKHRPAAPPLTLLRAASSLRRHSPRPAKTLPLPATISFLCPMPSRSNRTKT